MMTSWSPAAIDGLKPCATTAPWGALHERRELRLFVGPGVDIAEATAHVEAAQAYWAKHGVFLQLDQTVRALEVETFFPSDVEAKHQNGGARLRRALAPLRNLLHRLYLPAAPLTFNILVATEIAARGSPLGDLFDSFEGLAIPAPSRASSSSPLLDALGSEARTPTVLVSWRSTRPRGPAGLVVAHELGHLFGLGHNRGVTNLMSPSRRTDCLPVLDDAQILQLRERGTPPG